MTQALRLARELSDLAPQIDGISRRATVGDLLEDEFERLVRFAARAAFIRRLARFARWPGLELVATATLDLIPEEITILWGRRGPS